MNGRKAVSPCFKQCGLWMKHSPHSYENCAVRPILSYFCPGREVDLGSNLTEKCYLLENRLHHESHRWGEIRDSEIIRFFCKGF